MQNDPDRQEGVLSDIKYPERQDVVCGRGGHGTSHPGNVQFRLLVDQFKDRYLGASKAERMKLASELVARWRNQHPPGRFLTKTNPSQGDESLWHDIGDAAATKKALNTLRQRIPTNDFLAAIRKQDSTGSTGTRGSNTSAALNIASAASADVRSRKPPPKANLPVPPMPQEIQAPSRFTQPPVSALGGTLQARFEASKQLGSPIDGLEPIPLATTRQPDTATLDEVKAMSSTLMAGKSDNTETSMNPQQDHTQKPKSNQSTQLQQQQQKLRGDGEEGFGVHRQQFASSSNELADQWLRTQDSFEQRVERTHPVFPTISLHPINDEVPCVPTDNNPEYALPTAANLTRNIFSDDEGASSPPGKERCDGDRTRGNDQGN